MIGTVIGNYKIISKIGEGGMGSVFLAEHTKLSRKVAIKNLHDVLIKNEEIRKRFQNEAQAMAKLQHENIVNLLDFEENEDGLFLIMEFVDGAPLDELLKANAIPADQSLRIVQSILEGLKYAHKKDIVHRDIKPSNILIKGEDMSPKILDFGIAKMLGTDNSMTKTGTQMGTVFYMSPEQVKGEKVDQRSDIYAVGVTLFQLINGSNPYANLSTEYEVYNKIVTEELPDLTSKGVDQGVVDIISQATAKNVDERFQSCQDMIDAISDFLAGKKTSKKGKTKPKQKAPTSDKNLTNKEVQSGSKKGLWILLILLLLGGIGGGGYYLYDQGKFDEWFGGSDDDDDDDLCDCLKNATNEADLQFCDTDKSIDELYTIQDECIGNVGYEKIDSVIETPRIVWDNPEDIARTWVNSICDNNGVSRYSGFQLLNIDMSPFNDWSVYSSNRAYGSTSYVEVLSSSGSYGYENSLNYGGTVSATVNYNVMDPYNENYWNLTQRFTLSADPYNPGKIKITKMELIDKSDMYGAAE